MADLKIDADLPRLGTDVVEAAVAAEERGFDGLWTHETDGDAFLPVPLAAEHTTDVTIGTRIALAFTRSPMVLAYQAWDLARYSDGRFILGLGTQVKGHNERRFDVEWSSPGPRLREVVESIRHVFDVFQGEAELDYEGEHYSFSLMTDVFDAGPIDHPDVPIYVAGVNEYNVRLAGELCDGLVMHPFNTPEYAADVIRPTVAEGADRGGRSVEQVDLSAAPFVITGRDEEEMAEQREVVRRRIAFYGSTRTYHDVLAHHGWEDVGIELHELSKEGKWEAMADLVTDEMLAAFAVEARPHGLLSAVEDAYGGIADRVVVPVRHVDPSGGY